MTFADRTVVGQLRSTAVERSLPALLTALPGAGGAALLTAVVGAVLLLVLAHRGRGRDRLGATTGILALVVVGAATAGGLALRADAAASGLLPTLAARGGSAQLTMTVVAEPRPIARGWHVLVRVDRVEGTTVRERAALVVAEDPPALGDRWRATASARPLPDGGYGAWLAQQHARVLLDLDARELLGPGGAAARGSEWLRARVRRAATRHLDERTGGLLVGFVTGDTRLLPAADRTAMEATSLTHLTAVSGTNVAIVVGGVLAVVGLLGLPTTARRLAVVVVVPWFAFLTRFEPSVLRAGSMALVLLLAGTRGQVRDARHALSVAVLLLVLLDPRLAASLGLVLSASATAGVLLLAPVVRDRVPDRVPRRVATLIGVTIGAQLAVLPVLLATFGELHLVSLPANLVAVPAAIVAASLAFVATVLAVVHVGLAAGCFALAGPGAAVVLTVAETLAGRGGTIHVARPVTLVAAAAGTVWLVSGDRGRRRRLALGVLVVALVVAMLPAVTGSLPPDELRVTAIDVGQGDAFLVESPRARVLVDAGADDTAARWLRRHGRRHLDLVVVTHADLDHIGGVAEVLRRVRVGAMWMLPSPPEPTPAIELRAAAARRGVPVRAPAQGTRVHLGDLSIEVLHPPPGRPYRFARSERNESSVVLRVVHRGARVLLTGDIGLEAQSDLLAGPPRRLAADVLAVPHHGARTTDPAFLAAVGAEVALVSVGADNQYGHPHPDTLAAMKALGTQVRRTDLHGTVVVTVPGATVPGGPVAGGTVPGGPVPGATVRPEAVAAPLGCRHVRPPARRRRRPPAAAGGRAASGGAGGRRARSGRRPLRRLGARPPPGAQDHVAVRRPELCRAPRRGGAPGRAQGRGRAVPGGTLARRGPGAGGARDGPDPEDRQAHEGARRTDRRETAP
ncbi:MAG: DNA internalization-related competence protein ComEC/Rec2 [Nitriliruptoraceae bacterium]